MSMLEFMNGWDFRLDQAQSLAGYQVGAVALSDRLLKAAPLLFRSRHETILDKIGRDLDRFDEIRAHLIRVAKSQVDVGLPTHAHVGNNSRHYYIGDSAYEYAQSYGQDPTSYDSWYGTGNSSNN